MSGSWPELDYASWRETCAALHLYAQIVGKYRLARAPWVNHSWHATFYVNARGLTTSLVPDEPGGIEILIDLVEHAVVGSATNGRTSHLDLAPMSVAEFHDVHGQSQPGASVLGQLRPCGHALLRQGSAAASPRDRAIG